MVVPSVQFLSSKFLSFQTKQICYLYHASKLTRRRQRSRFSYSEASSSSPSCNSRFDSSPGSSPNDDDTVTSLAASTLRMEFLDSEEAVLNVSVDVHRVTGFLLKVSDCLEEDSKLNRCGWGFFCRVYFSTDFRSIDKLENFLYWSLFRTPTPLVGGTNCMVSCLLALERSS